MGTLAYRSLRSFFNECKFEQCQYITVEELRKAFSTFLNKHLMFRGIFLANCHCITLVRIGWGKASITMVMKHIQIFAKRGVFFSFLNIDKV